MKRKKSTFITIGISAVLIATAIWFVQGNNVGAWMGHRWWGMGFHHMMGGGMGFLMIVFWIVFIAAFIQFVSRAMNGSRNSQHNGDEKQTPLEILRIRYARGEIKKDEYNEKREDLLNLRGDFQNQYTCVLTITMGSKYKSYLRHPSNGSVVK